MNISYNWLKEYINLPLTPAETGDVLTSIGLETGGVEEVETIRGGLRGLVIGHVETCVAHPDSDHLHITTVDLGTPDSPVQIVCGAPNVAAGQTVVVATVGTTLYDGDKEFKIKKSKIRGVESFGMICAEDEIGVGTSHDGIIVIDENLHVKPGTPAAEFYNLESDYLLEVDLTPNRIDAASHYGVARDLNAWLGLYGSQPGNLHRPSVEEFAVEQPEGGIEVEVANPDACLRYCGVTIKGVTVAESPEWLRNRLTTIGLRPINNIVDITNYLLHAMGQPLHCFDCAKIGGGKVVVRNAFQGAKFTTLDGVEHTMDAADLMIANAAGQDMCIAGVFGGLDSGVTEASTDIFLESACFHPTSVRKTARRQGLSTDSSFRFERGVDPNGCLYILKLAALMVKAFAGGTITGPVVDIYPNPASPYPVDLSYNWLNSLIGYDLERPTVDKIFDLLEIKHTAAGDDHTHLEVPTYRYDVRRPCDVAEEVLRIFGYNNIPMKQQVSACLSYQSETDLANRLREEISNQLSANGFNEILNNSLTAESYYTDNTVYPAANCVMLMNPLSQELNVMRQTLFYGGLESISRNVNRRRHDLLMYEFGNVYHLDTDKESTPEHPLAPYSENHHLALWMSGNLRPGNWARAAQDATFFDLKATVANILGRLGVDSRRVTLTNDPDAPNSLFSQALVIGLQGSDKAIGRMGIASDEALKRFDIKQSVVYAELDWQALVKLSMKRNVTYTPLAKTHPVKRDLALLIDSATEFAAIRDTVRKAGGKLLRGVELFDVYEGKNLPAGKKSYAISLTLQDDEKTLQDKQIDAIMAKVVDALKKAYNAELR